MFANFMVNTPEVLCSLAESDVTSVIPTCDDLLDTNYNAIPGSSVSDSQTRPLEFVYKGSPSVYLDLNNSQIHLQCIFVDDSGSPIKPSDQKIGLVNHLGKFLYYKILKYFFFF